MSNFSIWNFLPTVLDTPAPENRLGNSIEGETKLPDVDLQLIVRPVSKLLLEGNQQLQEKAEKGIVVLGNAGVGKSRLISELSNRQELPGAKKNEVLVLKEEKLSENNVAACKPSSEPKVPTRRVTETINTWEKSREENDDCVRMRSSTWEWQGQLKEKAEETFFDKQGLSDAEVKELLILADRGPIEDNDCKPASKTKVPTKMRTRFLSSHIYLSVWDGKTQQRKIIFWEGDVQKKIIIWVGEEHKLISVWEMDEQQRGKGEEDLSSKQGLSDAGTNELLVLEEEEPFVDIVTGCELSSETKVPTKSLSEDTIIWEWPSFSDVVDPVQEIVNSCYIRKIFEVTEKIKYVLVVPETDMISEQGNQFIKTISNFIKIFKDFDCVPTGSLLLAVTKTCTLNNVRDIQLTIENILAINEQIDECEKEMILNIKEFSFLFPNKSEINDKDFSNLSKSAIFSGSYSEANVDTLKTNLSNIGAEYSNYLFNMTLKRFFKVLHVITEAIASANDFMSINDPNVFSKYHSVIKEWLFSPVHHIRPPKDVDKSRYFPNLEMQSKLKIVLSRDSLSKTSDGIKVFQQALGIFSDYADFADLQEIIQDYSCCLAQQYQLLTLFPAICKNELPERNLLLELISSCHEKVNKSMEHQVVNFCPLRCYYEEDLIIEEIQYLMVYKHLEICSEKIAFNYRELLTSTLERYADEAEMYCVLNKVFDKNHPSYYGIAAAALKKCGRYSEAIQLYIKIGWHSSIPPCYILWFDAKGYTYELTINLAVYVRTFRITSFHYVARTLRKKISELLKECQELAEKHNVSLEEVLQWKCEFMYHTVDYDDYLLKPYLTPDLSWEGDTGRFRKQYYLQPW